MTVQEAIAAAEQLLPGCAAPDGAEDARWQTIIAVGEFVEQEPNAIWPFVLRWGSHEDDDIRAAVASCLLEHLLEHHFALIFPRVEEAARSDKWFGNTTIRCGKFGQATEPRSAQLFDRLCSEIRGRAG